MSGAWATEWAEGPYRYVLMPKRWDDALPVLGVCGMNPSSASVVEQAASEGRTDRRKNGPDPTMTRIMGFAKRAGFGGVAMTNVCALRATDSTELAAHPDPYGPRNDVALDLVVDRVDAMLCCWGADPVVLTYVPRAMAILSLAKRLLCLGTTKQGHPRHPLYLKSATQMLSYRDMQPERCRGSR